MMELRPRWLRRLLDRDEAGDERADEVSAQVAVQVDALKSALQRLELREAARRNGGRPEAC